MFNWLQKKQNHIKRMTDDDVLISVLVLYIWVMQPKTIIDLGKTVRVALADARDIIAENIERLEK